MNKKNLKIISVNILALIAIYFCADIFCFYANAKFHKRAYAYSSVKNAAKYYIRTYKRIFRSYAGYEHEFIEGGNNSWFRLPMNVDSNKPPILIFGCSYAFGCLLTPEETIQGKLVKYTGRPVYNRALYGRGANEMLFQVRSSKFYSIIPKPEAVIYVFIPDQIRRTMIPCGVVDDGVYYDKNLKIKPNWNTPLFYTFKNIKNYFKNMKYAKFCLKVIIEIKNECQKHWGKDTKYIFLFYDNSVFWYNNLKPILEQEGFICLSLKDLTDKNLFDSEYLAEDNVHPNEKAWETITPRLVELTGL